MGTLHQHLRRGVDPGAERPSHWVLLERHRRLQRDVSGEAQSVCKEGFRSDETGGRTLTLRPVAVLIVLSLLSGCAVEKPLTTEVPKRLSLTWDHSDWRLCDHGECPKPTSKTVLLVAPSPTAEPVVRKPPNPAQVARKLAPISVTFQFASATLSDLAEMEIKKAAALIQPGDSIRVEGRTDDLGSQAFNNRLARKRAEVVAAYLKGLGVKGPIEIRFQGKCCYAIANTSDESRAINRRVDLHFSSTQKE